jgi:chromatin assembly factor 1 subunit B
LEVNCLSEVYYYQSRGSNQEIYDICWSPDGKLLAAGGVDGSVRIFDAGNEHKVLHVVAEHSRFVQGIAWDPLFEFIATQSNDRSVNIYNYTQDSIKTTPKLFTKHVKMMVDEVLEILI